MNLTLTPGQFPKNAEQAKLHKQAQLTKKNVDRMARKMQGLDNKHGVDSASQRNEVAVSDHVSLGQKIKNVAALNPGNGRVSGAASFDEAKDLKSLDVKKDIQFPLYGGTEEHTKFQTKEDGSKVYYSSKVGDGTLVHEQKDGTLFIEDNVGYWSADRRIADLEKPRAGSNTQATPSHIKLPLGNPVSFISGGYSLEEMSSGGLAPGKLASNGLKLGRLNTLPNYGYSFLPNLGATAFAPGLNVALQTGVDGALSQKSS